MAAEVILCFLAVVAVVEPASLITAIVLSSGTCWHCVETTAANKNAFSCDEDLMCLSHSTSGICLPPMLLSR